MTWLHEQRGGSVASALAGCAVAVEQTAPGRWSFALADLWPIRAIAELDTDWLWLEAPLLDSRSDGVPDPHQCLLRTVRLPRGTKYILTNGLRLRARVELLLADGIDLGEQIAFAVTGLKKAAEWLPEASTAPLAETGDAWEVSPVAGQATPDLARICSAAGWAFTPREASMLMAPLEVGDAFVQALLSHSPEKGVVAAVPVPTVEGRLSTGCQRAVAALMLRTAGVVRMVRATATDDDTSRFEVPLGHVPASDHVGNAFAALSLAWRLAGRAAEVLACDEGIARRYLEMFGTKD